MEMCLYSTKYVDKILRKHGYTIINDNKDADTNQCMIYFKNNVIVQVYYKKTTLGNEVIYMCIVDNNYSLSDIFKRYIVTSRQVSSIFKYNGIPIDKILDYAIGDLTKLNMRIENSITEEALEQL
jgi:hypothetical protein